MDPLRKKLAQIPGADTPTLNRKVYGLGIYTKSPFVDHFIDQLKTTFAPAARESLAND